jgi:hypothetical protein
MTLAEAADGWTQDIVPTARIGGSAAVLAPIRAAAAAVSQPAPATDHNNVERNHKKPE